MRRVLGWFALVGAAAALGCGGSGSTDSTSLAACAASGPSASGASGIGTTSFTVGSWTWVDVPGTMCNDGSRTGFAVNRGTGEDLVIYLEGGGACWDYQTCFVAQNASTGPAQAAQFDFKMAFFRGTYLDRAFAPNPFAEWSIVYVPYCTGDLHAGSSAATYRDGEQGKVWQHCGRVNLAADLQVIQAAFPSPRRLVIAGSSAGGFGSLLQYDAIRAAFHAGSVYLLDDSGPPLEGDWLAPVLRNAWRTHWNLDPLLATTCAGCENDFSRIVEQLATRYPADPIALLSSMQDATMSRYFGLAESDFQSALTQTVRDRYVPTAHARTFLLPGNAHGLLATPSASAGGVTLTTWITQMLLLDPGWRSVGP